MEVTGIFSPADKARNSTEQTKINISSFISDIMIAKTRKSEENANASNKNDRARQAVWKPDCR